MCSCWGIPCSLTAGPPTHNWSGSRSISASRPSLMPLSPALPFVATPPSLHPPPFFSLALSLQFPLFLFFFISLPLSPSPFFLPLSLHSLRGLATGALSGGSRKKINNIILIQTDIKRHRASKPFLCRLIISLCFSTPFIFCRLVPSIPSLEGSSGLHSPGMSERSLDVTFDTDKFGRVATSIYELPSMRNLFLW